MLCFLYCICYIQANHKQEQSSQVYGPYLPSDLPFLISIPIANILINHIKPRYFHSVPELHDLLPQKWRPNELTAGSVFWKACVLLTDNSIECSNAEHGTSPCTQILEDNLCQYVFPELQLLPTLLGFSIFVLLSAKCLRQKANGIIGCIWSISLFSGITAL